MQKEGKNVVSLKPGIVLQYQLMLNTGMELKMIYTLGI